MNKTAETSRCYALKNGAWSLTFPLTQAKRQSATLANTAFDASVRMFTTGDCVMFLFLDFFRFSFTEISDITPRFVCNRKVRSYVFISLLGHPV
jgi:hypothetical protein